MYKVYGSQIEFVDGVTGVFILRIRSLVQNRPLSTEHRICGRVNCPKHISNRYSTKHGIPKGVFALLETFSTVVSHY